MTTKLAEIEIFIIDEVEKYGFGIKNIKFDTKRVDKIIVDGQIRYLPSVREVLVVSFDLLINEGEDGKANMLTNLLEDYLSSKVEYYYLSGNYYINHN